MLRLSVEEYQALAGKPKINRRNQANRGMAAEALVELQCRRYEEAGIAVIRKIATPWRVIRHGELAGKGQWVAFPARKSTVDFQGVWEGAAVAFDVKSVARGNRLYLRDAILPPHQKEFMRRWVSAGGTAFLLTLFGGEEWRLAPWCQAEAVLREGGAGLSREDMALVPGLDFLAVLGSRACPAPDCSAMPIMGSCGRWWR